MSAPANPTTTAPEDFWYSRPRARLQRNPDRFFARLTAFLIACPRCGHTTLCGRARNPRFKHSGRATKAWDPLRCRWCCQECGLRLVLGVVAWCITPGFKSHPPIDTVPTIPEAMQLRDASRPFKLALTQAAVSIGETRGPDALRKVRADLKSRARGAPAQWDAFGSVLFGVLERERRRTQVRKPQVNVLNPPSEPPPPGAIEEAYEGVRNRVLESSRNSRK